MRQETLALCVPSPSAHTGHWISCLMNSWSLGEAGAQLLGGDGMLIRRTGLCTDDLTPLALRSIQPWLRSTQPFWVYFLILNLAVPNQAAVQAAAFGVYLSLSFPCWEEPETCPLVAWCIRKECLGQGRLSYEKNKDSNTERALTEMAVGDFHGSSWKAQWIRRSGYG